MYVYVLNYLCYLPYASVNSNIRVTTVSSSVPFIAHSGSPPATRERGVTVYGLATHSNDMQHKNHAAA